MLTVTVHSRTAWNDYFTGSPTPQHQKEYGTRQTFSDTNVHVSNCLFRSITSSTNGGALCCTSVTYLLIESTSFFSCNTSTNGGAIYFTNNGGECVLYKVCGNECCITSSYSGLFAYISVNNIASSKNYVNYSSISRCLNEVSGSSDSLCLYYGKICCPSVNISMNKCWARSGIICGPFVVSNTVTCSLSYSSFTDNNSFQDICIYFSSGGAEYEMKSCNILRNDVATKNSYGTILSYGNLMIQDSCILENRAARNFYTSSSYTTTLSNCTVDSTANNGNLRTQNTVTKSFVLALKHMSTQNCHANYDSVGTLTAFPDPPSSTKKEICYTDKRLSYFIRIINFISISHVFIFSFVYPYSS
jgi:hypothetical protein